MQQIEKALHSHHADTAATPTPAVPDSSYPPVVAPTPIIEAVFATVNSVTPSSPADQAGLKAGDKVKRFGSVGALNHEKLSKVATEVQQNENVRKPPESSGIRGKLMLT